MKKQLTLVLLQTQNKTNALLGYSDKSKLFIRPYSGEYSDQNLEKYESAYYHLYAISDELVKVGDYYISSNRVLQWNQELQDLIANHEIMFKEKSKAIPNKVVITTDESLTYCQCGNSINHKMSCKQTYNLPTFTNEFIKLLTNYDIIKEDD